MSVAEKVPTDESAPASAPAGDSTVPEHDDGPSVLRAYLRAMPGWVASSLFHMILLLTLALLTMRVAGQEAEVGILMAVAEQADPILPELLPEPVEFESPQLEPTSDPGVAALGEPIQMEAVAAAQIPLDASLGDFGQPFGDLGQGLGKLGEGTGGAEFFGVKAAGDRFFFLVDSSTSMRDGKFQAACDELLAAVERLGEKRQFYVIFFDHDTLRMFGPGAPAAHSIAATRKNVYRLRDWMYTVQLEHDTMPLDAMRFAIDARPDAIYLLTDGQFGDNGRTVQYLAGTNYVDDDVSGKRSPRVTIHTIGFWNQNSDQALRAIAKDYGGTFRFVPRPAGK